MRHFPNIVGMPKTKDKRRCLGVSVIVEGQLSSCTGWEAFPVKRLSLQRGPKSPPTHTTCKFAVSQKGLFVIRSQGLLRKGDSRHLGKTRSLGMKYGDQELTATLTCLKAAQDSLQVRASWALGHAGQSRPFLPARKVLNVSWTHLQAPLAYSKLDPQRYRGYVLGAGAPALQHVLEQHKGQDSAPAQLQKPSLEETVTAELIIQLLRN